MGDGWFNDEACGAGPWADAVPTFAAAGYPCPQYKNPTDYFMKIACEEEGIRAMVATQGARWKSTKRAAFSGAPAAADGAANGELRGVEVQGGGHVSGGDLTIMDSPEARCCSCSCTGAVVDLLRRSCSSRVSSFCAASCHAYSGAYVPHA